MNPVNESIQKQGSFAFLRQSKTALLTSFRRNGQGVGTPVGLAVVGNRAYFTTWSTTGKIKRLANNPRVTLASCTQRGKPLGPTVEGTARRLEGVEAKEARKYLGGALRFWIWALIYKLVFRAQPVLYEVVPEPGLRVAGEPGL
ncbi:MAG TPA: PPOX class F420-dependent oxidoreductase [Ktedonobacteraceae bacterium]|nr:PPOX class F420-dependent oxidoreductase [Ktedonobacteraceae bacterium]